MRILPLICICVIMFSCSVKKRSYRKGFYIDWAFHKDKKTDIPLKKHHANLPQKNAQLILAEQETELSVTAEKSLSHRELKKPAVPDLGKNAGCDTLFFRDGKVVAAKILEILPNEIKYKRCDYPDGPMNTVNKNDVAQVVYANGVSEKFEIKHKAIDNEYSSQKQSDPQEKRTHKAAFIMIGITASIFVFSIISSIAGLIYAPIALSRIYLQRDKFDGEDIVKVCRTICLISLIFFLLIIALYIFLLLTII